MMRRAAFLIGMFVGLCVLWWLVIVLGVAGK